MAVTGMICAMSIAEWMDSQALTEEAGQSEENVGGLPISRIRR
jgi:hypothetical protein